MMRAIDEFRRAIDDGVPDGPEGLFLMAPFLAIARQIEAANG